MRLVQFEYQGPNAFNSMKTGKVLNSNPILTKTHVLSKPSRTELWKNLFIYVHVQTHRNTLLLSSYDKQETKINKAVSMGTDEVPPGRRPRKLCLSQ